LAVLLVDQFTGFLLLGLRSLRLQPRALAPFNWAHLILDGEALPVLKVENLLLAKASLVFYKILF